MISTGMTVAAFDDADLLGTEDRMSDDAIQLARVRVGQLVVVSADKARS